MGIKSKKMTYIARFIIESLANCICFCFLVMILLIRPPLLIDQFYCNEMVVLDKGFVMNNCCDHVTNDIWMATQNANELQGFIVCRYENLHKAYIILSLLPVYSRAQGVFFCLEKVMVCFKGGKTCLMGWLKSRSLPTYSFNSLYHSEYFCWTHRYKLGLVLLALCAGVYIVM